MSRLMITSDLHLGHKAICKYRTSFTTEEEHHEILFDNLASSINKRDSLMLLGDVAFSQYWLDKLKEIKCVKKLLIVGNHDLERGIKMRHLVETYTDVKSLYSYRNMWFTHCPIHPQELRAREYNIHGHLHDKQVMLGDVKDSRYINVCVEHTDWKPISFHELIERQEDLLEFSI